MTDAHFPDADLSREVENLIGKIIAGNANADDIARYKDLSERLISHMQPSWVDRALSRRREHRKVA